MVTLGPYNPDNGNDKVEFKAQISQTRSNSGYSVTIAVYARRTLYYSGGTDGTLNIMYYIGNTTTPIKTSDNKKVIIFGDEGWMSLGSYTYNDTLSALSSKKLTVGFSSKRTYSSGPLEWNLGVKYTTITIPASTTYYTIKYNANRGSGSMADTTVTYGTAVKISDNTFKRKGYAFVGWYLHRKSDDKWLYALASGSSDWYTKGTEPEGATLKLYSNGSYSQTASSIDGDIITLYAQWLPIEITNVIEHCALGFKNNEGNNDSKDAFILGPSSVSVKTDTIFSLNKSFACPIPNGFYLNNFGTSAIADNWATYPMDTEVKQADSEMFFQYNYEPNTYYITYNLAGGINNPDNPNTYNVLYGVTFKEPTRAGYVFDGWYVDGLDNSVCGINEGKNASFASADDLYSQLSSRTIGDITVTAKWKLQAMYKGEIKTGTLYARKSKNESFKPIKEIYNRKSSGEEFTKVI